MCGIAVWINRKGEVDPRILSEAISLQQHRGPDNTKSMFYNDSFDEVLSTEALDQKDNKTIKIGIAHT